MRPTETKARRELLWNAEFSAPRLNPLLRSLDLNIGGFGGSGPRLVVIKVILGRDLAFEIGKEFGRTLLRRRLLNFLALPDQPLQLLALAFGHLNFIHR